METQQDRARVRWPSKQITGLVPSGVAAVHIDPKELGGVTFLVEWLRDGRTGFGSVEGEANSIEEAQDLIDAMVYVREKYSLDREVTR